MKIYLDTANLDQIREASELGIINGVTTNPSLVAKEGVNGIADTKAHFAKICELMDGNISVEVIATDMEGMIAEAHELISIDPRIVVKAPATRTGLKVIHRLSDQGIKTNCTLVFSVLQALAAMKAGATYVSPFVGRLEDKGVDGLGVIAQMVQMKKNYEFETEILCASVRTQNHIQRCIELGVDIVTCPYEFVLTFYDHPQTEDGLKKFLMDYHA
ncbi:MAG: fructose-6-phosphate aldolase [Opitutales bacterium]|nr:fructose-6-phosphate aldolase [Opitutales bacterium]